MRYDADSNSPRWSMIETPKSIKEHAQRPSKTDAQGIDLERLQNHSRRFTIHGRQELGKINRRTGGIDLDSGITFSVDATNGARRLTVSIEITGPFTDILELRFPRWAVYFIRANSTHVRIECQD